MQRDANLDLGSGPWLDVLGLSGLADGCAAIFIQLFSILMDCQQNNLFFWFIFSDACEAA